MAVVSVLVLHAVDLEQRAKYRRKQVRYRVLCSDPLDGPDAIIGSALVPEVDESTYVSPFKYGNDSDSTLLICRSLGNFKKVNTSGLWEIDAEFIYDRDNDPEAKGVKVTPLTRVEQELVEFAEFRGWYKSNEAALSADGNLVEDGEISDTDVEELDIGAVGPITNSAGTPILPAPERRVGKSGIRVQWSKQSAVEYSDFIGCANNATIGIADTYGDFDVDFEPGTLILISADQDPVDYYNERWFDVTLEFEIVTEYGDIYELDRGLAESVYFGDDDGKGGEYDSSSLPPSGKRPILGTDGQPISEPVPLDGQGKVIEAYTPAKARWLRYRIAPPKDFDQLQIGDHD